MGTKGRACVGKKPYATKTDAKNAVWALVRQQGARPASLDTYRCDHCGAWHVGHKPRRRR